LLANRLKHFRRHASEQKPKRVHAGLAGVRNEEAMFRRFRYDLIYRLLARAAEVAAEPGVSIGVKQVYEGVLAPCSVAFCKGHEAVADAEGAAKQARRIARERQEELDPVYREARLVVLAFLPDKTLPGTLGVQLTDTDTLAAVTALSAALQSSAGESWASAVLQGPYGTLAPKVIEALHASIAATKALAAARQERAKARKPAYDKYQVFKRIVRETLGASSVQYRRLHVRPKVAKQIEEAQEAEEAAPESAVVPSTKGGSATQTGGPMSVKVA
jgi:hypothetical protein